LRLDGDCPEEAVTKTGTKTFQVPVSYLRALNTAEALVQAQISPYDTWAEQNYIWAGLSPYISIFFPDYYFTNAPHLFITDSELFDMANQPACSQNLGPFWGFCSDLAFGLKWSKEEAD
jgi:hypothetical protein